MSVSVGLGGFWKSTSNSAPRLLSGSGASVLCGEVECVGLRSWPGPLGELQADEERDDEEDEGFEGEQHQQESCWRVKPRTSLQITALASPEKVANACMKTWNRIALLNVTRDGNVKVDYQEGEVSRINLSGIAWLQGRRKDFLCNCAADGEGASSSEACCRKAGPLVFCEDRLAVRTYRLGCEEDVGIRLPPGCRPGCSQRCFLVIHVAEEGETREIHAVCLIAEPSGHSRARRSHAWGRKRNGSYYDVPKSSAIFQLAKVAL